MSRECGGDVTSIGIPPPSSCSSSSELLVVDVLLTEEVSTLLDDREVVVLETDTLVHILGSCSSSWGRDMAVFASNAAGRTVSSAIEGNSASTITGLV